MIFICRHVCFEMKIPVRAVGRWTEYSPTVGSHWIELRTPTVNKADHRKCPFVGLKSTPEQVGTPR
ncbi:DUF72 domain-containing protein [Caenorhabditis elegans]|uniref:DUF72 domain-containing protein n=1 Tax=Caenorhabditis elegans TaxID=6239 RepID=Q9N3V7_CAEEL|nr:DUF72 domain-containing protein [Caenorhabditis elegans]CCD73784.2 DUF72 domain-containing protein [Caenorhabditis elegans]